MLRTDFARGISELGELFERSQLEAVLRHEAQRMGGGVPPAVVIASSRQMFAFANSMPSATRAIVKALNLTDVFEEHFWIDVLRKEGEASKQSDKKDEHMFVMLKSVQAFKEILPQIVSLLSRGHHEASSSAETSQTLDETVTNKESDLIELILHEGAGEVSSADRLVMAVEGLTKIYEGISRIQGKPESGLTVLSCDSGSDKVFVFRGAADVVKEVRKLIGDIWDRVAYHGERKQSERLKSISESLTIVEKIAELERGKKISPEQAELARRNILSGARLFIGAGAQTSDIRDRPAPNPNSLLRPQESLLLAGPSKERDESNSREFAASSNIARKRRSKLTPSAEQVRSDIEGVEAIASLSDPRPSRPSSERRVRAQTRNQEPPDEEPWGKA